MGPVIQSSWTRLAGVRARSSWFVQNIMKARPRVNARAEPRNPRRHHPRATRHGEPGRLEVIVASEKVCSDRPVQDANVPLQPPCPHDKTLRSVRRLKRIGGRPVVALKIVNEEQESDAEDFGCMRSSASSSLGSGANSSDTHQFYSIADEDSCEPSVYLSAVSHLTDLHGLSSAVLPWVVDEQSGVVFSRVCLGRNECSSAATGPSTVEYGTPPTSVPPICPTAQASGTLDVLGAPSLMLTLPTPQIEHSPVFVPRSPITLSKYVEATTPVRARTCLASLSEAPLSAAPEVPSCDRCCLAQLEEGFVCRACEKQWLACKMWYQANDGGRRQWLTEPYIKPAESTASIRAVMGDLGVPGSSGAARSNHGLGLGPSVPFQRRLPFRVLATTSDTVERHAPPGVNSGSSRFSVLGCRIADAKGVALIRGDHWDWDSGRKARAVFRALWSTAIGLVFPGTRDTRSSIALRTRASDDRSETWRWAAHIGGHQGRALRAGTLSAGSTGAGRITSSSRFVEHLR
ncbi:hypothetical protein BD413DRAFT_119337 [Trametes elegans]|nr:hypothetical protein BD413DRAFT_119337 [Trametes elegans]